MEFTLTMIRIRAAQIKQTVRRIQRRRWLIGRRWRPPFSVTTRAMSASLEDEPSVRNASARNGLVGYAMEFVTHPTGHAPLVGSEADGA